MSPAPIPGPPIGLVGILSYSKAGSSAASPKSSGIRDAVTAASPIILGKR
jgi:hypothetical protein